ncbi:MAG: hypothetical protein R3B13_41095 [Polyangiaceae bacterium]
MPPESALSPEQLRRHYQHFLAADRVYLTGHSHQAWPDVAREGLLESFDDAARHLDDKWGLALAKADAVRAGIAARIGGAPNEFALGANTHELVSRLLSAFDLRARPRLVTTSGEFHSMARQLRRLAEAGIDVRVVEAEPVATLAERLGAELNELTAAVLCSSVLFRTSSVVPDLPGLARAADALGVVTLLDIYHAFNVVPFQLGDYPESVFVTGGGYKYAQWGEGVCFLRVPPSCTLRPVYTGWFADFEHLDAAQDERVQYGPRGADRFAGSTYDPASHYRAARVIEFASEQGLDVATLRRISLRQTGLLLAALEGFEVLTPQEPAARGGFVALRRADASELVQALRREGVFADARGDVLRLGPAPYVTDPELERAVAALRHLCR